MPSAAPSRRRIPARVARPCACTVSRHPRAEEVDADLRRLGTPAAPPDERLTTISQRYGLAIPALSVHRRKHLGMLELYLGRPAKDGSRRAPHTPAEEEERREARRAPNARKPIPPRAPDAPLLPIETPEGIRAQLVKTIATLIQLGSYRGLSTVKALAYRHGVSEAEVLTAHRRAVLSVKDGRGGLREQLELSIGVLGSIRDQERKVADDYTGIADRLIDEHLPGTGPNRPPPTLATEHALEKAKIARGIAAQAQDNAISAQKQIDQNTIHRRTAPLVQVSFSASPDFGRALDAAVLLFDTILGPTLAERLGLREKVERGLAIFEDGGERLDAPEFLEHLGELQADAEALETTGDASSEA